VDTLDKLGLLSLAKMTGTTEPTPRGVLERVTPHRGINRNARCLCGSGKKFKACCRLKLTLSRGP
jgi:uncharacterized protein YecA (UPF0149 family)